MLKIAPTDDLLAKYTNLQLTKKKQSAQKKFKWIVCKIDGPKIIECCSMSLHDVKKQMEEEKKDTDIHKECHASFIAALQKTGEPRYGMCDYRDKVFFVSHIPENSKRGPKMTYATVRENFKETLSGIGCAIQSTEAGDLAREEFDIKIPVV